MQQFIKKAYAILYTTCEPLQTPITQRLRFFLAYNASILVEHLQYKASCYSFTVLKYSLFLRETTAIRLSCSRAFHSRVKRPFWLGICGDNGSFLTPCTPCMTMPTQLHHPVDSMGAQTVVAFSC